MSAVWGTVTSSDPLEVSLDSGDAELPALALASYAPTTGDRVVVLRDVGLFVVLGTTDTLVIT